MKVLKRILIALLCLILAFAATAAVTEGMYYPQYVKHRRAREIPCSPQADEIALVSSNVRCISPFDLGKKSWFYRADLLMRTLENAGAADVIGFQEVTKTHYKYLCESLPQYDSVITYRDNSLLAEGCPVFYHKDKFDLTDKGSFWLSETPDQMSRGWDAAFNRVCSYVLLREKQSGRELAVFNVHLDHIGRKARAESIKLILEKVTAFGGQPCVIMGDLNCGEKSDTYLTATSLFSDAKYLAPDTCTGATYHNWGAALDRENLDYFLISKTGITPLAYRILNASYGGVYPSDHFPVSLKITLD